VAIAQVASLILAAATLFEGVGLLLAVGAVFAWFLRPLWQALRYIVVGAPFERPRRTRFAIIAAAASALIGWGMVSVPVWYSVKLPGVVEYVDAAPINLGRFASVRLVGDGCSATGTLRQVEPRATTHPPHPALCAGAGGPIATKVTAEKTPAVGHDPQELLEPHVVCYVRLASDDSLRFGTGQLATVRIAGPSQSLAELLREQTRQWIMTRMRDDR
jgi:hypothetical protein